jgi:hypothetical protein
MKTYLRADGSLGEKLQPFLPGPSGPFGIGTRTFSVVDSTRVDFATVSSSKPRRLLAQVWYPAKASGVLSPLIDDPLLPSVLEEALKLPPILDFLGTLGSYARPGAAPRSGSYPLLIFLSGLAGFRQSNLFQVEYLVSHGYVVVGVDVPGISATVSFPDGSRVPALAAKAAGDLVLQSVAPESRAPRLYGREYPEGIIPELTRDVHATLAFLDEFSKEGFFGFIDLSRIGAFGVSLGGITVAELLRTDYRLKAGLMMDSPAPVSVVNEGLVPSALWVTRDASSMRAERARFGGWDESAIDLHQSSIDTGCIDVSKQLAIERESSDAFGLHRRSVWLPTAAAHGYLGRLGAGVAHSPPQQGHESVLRLLPVCGHRRRR